MSGWGYVRAAKHAALRQTLELAATLRNLEAPASEIAATLRAHHISGLVRSALGESPTPFDGAPALLAALDAVRPMQMPTNDELRSGFNEVSRRLEHEGVPVLLLKGQYLAERLYQVPAWRPQFDIDVLVRERHHRKASRNLVAGGFVRTAYDQHSVTFSRGDLKVDLHHCLRSAPAYKIDEDAIWASAPQVRVGGLEARTLSDEYLAVLLVLGAFEDLGQGMTRLKQMVDLYLFSKQLEQSCDWNAFFRRRESEGLADVAAAVLALVVALFEAGAELPRLAAALNRRGHFPDATVARTALDLVFAVRKSPDNLAWFQRVYPGSFPRYLLWFWLGGFPANVRGLWTGRATETLSVLLGRHQRT